MKTKAEIEQVAHAAYLDATPSTNVIEEYICLRLLMEALETKLESAKDRAFQYVKASGGRVDNKGYSFSIQQRVD